MKGKSDVGYVEIQILDTFEYVPIQVGPYARSCSDGKLLLTYQIYALMSNNSDMVPFYCCPIS